MFQYFGELTFFSNQLNKRDKEKIYAILSEAIHFTRIQIKRYRRNGIDQESPILSFIWLDALGQLQLMRKPQLNGFIETMKLKSDYWSDPSRYNDYILVANKMQLDFLERELIQLVR